MRGDPWVLIASPVFKRAWILPEWLASIERQDWPLSQLGFVFEGAPDDEETQACLWDFFYRHPEIQCFDVTINRIEAHYEHPSAGRYWTAERYHAMARMRNNLLAKAYAMGPDRYFSLDTDILLENPSTISKLVELTEESPVVAPLAYMSANPLGLRDHPNVMSWIEGSERAYRRRDYPLEGLFQADIIMAVKMMRPEVYTTVQYQWHRQGEDLGFCWQCRAHNIKLYSCPSIYTPHVMYPSLLEEYRVKGDPRSPIQGTADN